MVWIISQLVLLFLISVDSQPNNHQEPLPVTPPAAVPHEEAHEHQPAQSVPSEMINNEGEPHSATPKTERRQLATGGDTTEKKGNSPGLADEPLILHTDPIPGAELFTLTADKDKACPG